MTLFSARLTPLLSRGSLFIGVAAAALSGCAGGETNPAPEDVGPATGEIVGEFVLKIRPREGRATLHRLAPTAPSKPGAPGLSPQAMTDVNIQADGLEGSGPANSVELVTTNIVDTFGTGASGGCPADSFCADVKLNSFWTRSLNFTYAQVTAITDSSGQPLSGHGSFNSDPALTTGLSNFLGLWQYQSPGVANHFSNGSTGVMISGAANGATKTWKFANPDDADTNVYLRVMAATTYSNYSLGTQFNAYIDACTVNVPAGEASLAIKLASSNVIQTQPTNSANPVYLLMPFPFTFYGTTNPLISRVNFSKWTAVAFDPTATTISDSNLALPSTGAPHAGFFVFWDQLRWPTSGSGFGMCAKVIGTTPNRQVAISWNKVAFSGGGAQMTIGAVLNEASEEIWFNYQTMVGNSPTGGATVGAQNEAGTLAATGSLSAQLTFANGTGKVLLPIP